MTNLSNTILAHYLRNLDLLPQAKRFHFAARLHLWQVTNMDNELLALRPWFTSNDQPRQALHEALQHPDYGSRNVLSLRQPSWDKYPELAGYTTLLVRATFLQTIYDLDCRD